MVPKNLTVVPNLNLTESPKIKNSKNNLKFGKFSKILDFGRFWVSTRANLDYFSSFLF